MRTEPQTDDRRGFGVKLAAIAAAALAFGTPLVAGLIVLLDPLRRRNPSGRFLRVASLAAVPADGIPRSFPVVAERRDAWNRFAAEPIGGVFLRHMKDGQVTALNGICPHAGCFVGFDGTRDRFACPCHKSEFRPDGTRIDPERCPSPRDLDALAVEIRGAEIWVRFENFRAGTREKILA